ncbi:rasGAP-activating-like protein 1 isoform X2 [Oculina patagonica]
MAKSTILYLRIGEGKNLPKKDISGKSDPYCIVKVDNEVVARTATVWRDLEPFWGEEYTMFLPVGFTNLSVYVYDEDTIGFDDLIGRVAFDREMLAHSPKGVDKWFPLSPVDMYNYSDIQGEIRIEATLYEKGDVKKVRAKVLEVRDLPETGRNSLEPTVKFSLGETSTGTSQMRLTLRETVDKLTEGYKKSWFPAKQKWLEYDLKDPLQDVKMTADLKIESESLCCSGQLKPGQSRDSWYKLTPMPHIKEHKTENLGSIRMKVRLTQEHILPQKCYQSLVDILVNSIKDPVSLDPTALSLIEQLNTADQAILAHQLVRLFIGQDVVIPFLDYLTLREIRDSSNPRTLFRGNSLAAKCMEQFMKIVGMPYLLDTIKPVIDKIFEERKYCELDPSKNAERKHSALRRLSLKPVDEQDRSLSVMSGYLETVMTSILSSIKECPSYMRAAFRNLARRVSDHFGDEAGYEDSKYTAVSGFLFLRFFAPAILGPKLFGLRENHADKNVSRTLTILAKTVQKIGNIELPMHNGKEEWMGPLYKWIAFYTDEVKDFLDRLADVEDEEVPGCDHRRTVFSHSLIIKEGSVKKCRYRDTRLPKPYKFKKRYCWLSTENFLYAKTNDSQTRQFLPTRKILAVERVDESAFQKPNVFQVVSKDYDDTLQILYLAAQDVNEMNQWLSAIRKTTISNPKMLSYFHPGVFHKNKWTCCKRVIKTAGGCQLTRTHVTLSDWRDPLDPDSEAQMIFTQLLQSRDELRKKFLETKEPQKDSLDEHTAVKDAQTSSAASEKAVATKLLEVIDELEKAHEAIEEKAITKS